jgi:hypothetical protein
MIVAVHFTAKRRRLSAAHSRAFKRRNLKAFDRRDRGENPELAEKDIGAKTLEY